MENAERVFRGFVCGSLPTSGCGQDQGDIIGVFFWAAPCAPEVLTST